MNGAELMKTIIKEMNAVIMGDVKDLTPEQLTWKPASGANPIGFLFWHTIRTEDNVVLGMLGKPPIWESQKWSEKLGMDAGAQGTGFQQSEADKAAAMPLAEVMAYAESVIQATDDYLDSLDDAKLDFAPNPERPKRNIAMMLRNFIIAHGWWHIGEIKYIKGMQGMPSPR
jgi:hypothetical protein